MDKIKIDNLFDFSLGPKLLREIFVKTDFENIFHDSISTNVIKILSPQILTEPHNLVFDEDQIQNNLIAPLERFICGLGQNASAEEISNVIEHLKTLKQPSKLCRRVLKTGDVLFSCNDCGYDATCVVCIDCFHKSAHKDHNYRMSNTDGGGCCDCGDVEAWKQNYACSDHMADKTHLTLADFQDRGSRSKQREDDKCAIMEKINLLPKNMAARFFLVCQAALHYARFAISWEDKEELPCYYIPYKDDELIVDELIDGDRLSQNFFTVLYNDEVHTYDHVINTLVKVIKCSKMTASIMASTVSREGRTLIHRGDYKSCKQVRDLIVNVRDAGQGPLRVEVFHGSVLAHQTFALRLIEWIRSFSLICDAFRVITAYTLLGGYNRGVDDKCITLVEKIMLSNTFYWKMARIDWNDLFVTTLLTDYSIKETFARMITGIYKELVQYFIDDDHDHSVSILTMTTQLYTVPSLVCMLIEEENALAVIAKTLLDTCHDAKRKNRPQNFENRTNYDMHRLKRGFYIIHDLKYLINIEPTLWTDELRENVIKAVDIFLDLLVSMQGMDSVKRQQGQHIEYEPDWESGMTLQSRLIAFITRLVTFCSLDNKVLVETLRLVQRRLINDTGFKMVKRDLHGHVASCIQYDVSTSPVSVHLPLTRFCAALILEMMKVTPSDEIPYKDGNVIVEWPKRLLKDSSKRRPMIEIMEHSLRTEVMIAQFRSGMWRRNGYSLVNQIMYFHGPIMRREMFDRDILLLQEAAAMIDADEFMIHLLNKFQLFTWVNSDTTRVPVVGEKAVGFHNDEEIMAQTMSLGEEFLQLLLTIIGERYTVGVGMIEESDVLKNEIIQLLCISPSTRSELTQKLYVNDNELDCIKAVANLRRSTEASTGKYELKDEYYERFNPFFYHYTRRHQSNALDAQLKRKRNLKESLICCPPPAPVQLNEQFLNLNELLKCDITLLLIQKILTRALGSVDENPECSTKASIRFSASDLQLDQCLHLVGLGLYEQERNPTTFRYLQAAHDKDIFPLLKECYERAKRSKDLIFWLMKKAYELIMILDDKHADSMDEAAVKINAMIKSSFEPILSARDDMKQEGKKRNSELAAQRRERIMAMMKANQNKFLSNPTTKQLVAETEKNEAPAVKLSSNQPMNLSTYDLRSKRKTAVSQTNSESSSSLTEHQRQQSTKDNTNEETPMDYDNDKTADCESIDMLNEDCDRHIEQTRLCILCRDEQRIDFDQPTMVLLAYIQRSAVLSKNRKERRIPNYMLTPSNQLRYQMLFQASVPTPSEPETYSFTSDNSWSFDATFMPSDLFFGPHISTCGHVMHHECWLGFFDAVMKRENSRPNRSSRHVSYELDKREILCPLCECISNATIPLLPDYTKFVQRLSTDLPPTIFASPRSVIQRSSDNLSICLRALRATVDNFNHVRHIKDSSSAVSKSSEDRYMRLMQPKSFNEALEDLGETENLSLREFVNSTRSDRILSSTYTTSLLSSLMALADRIQVVGLDLDPSIQNLNHARKFMMSTWSISYTIQAHERVQRFKGLPILADLNSSKNLCLSSLLKYACSSMLIFQPDMMQNLLVRKLRYLFINEEHLSTSPCCLDIDVFELFVSLYILLQKLYAHVELPSASSTSGSGESAQQPKLSTDDNSNYPWTTKNYDHEYYRNLVHLMLVLNMLQVIITLQNESANNQDTDRTEDTISGSPTKSTSSSYSEQDPSGECHALQNFYREIILASGHPHDKMPQVDEIFASKIRNRLLPYLRSSAIFFYHLSHISPPEKLKTGSAFFEGKNFLESTEGSDCTSSEIFVDAQETIETQFNVDATNEEFAAICHYLDLPNDFRLLLQSPEVRHLARSWMRHSRVLILIRSSLKRTDPTQGTNSSSKSSIKRVESCPIVVEAGKTRKISKDSGPSTPLGSASGVGTSTLIQNKSELMPVKLIRQPHSVNRLVDLPYDYSELVDKVSDFTCPSIKNEDSRAPTMCLICGVMLCSQSYCCQRDLNDLASSYAELLERQQEARRNNRSAGTSSAQSVLTEGQRDLLATIHNVTGRNGPNPMAASTAMQWATSVYESVAAANANQPNEGMAAGSSGSFNPISSLIHQQLVGSCTYHAHQCSGGIGVFLRVRTCQILLLSGRSKGCYMAAPYIDDHGETDYGLMRGNPLHLNRQHYEKLQQTWLSHSIPELISRTLEYSTYLSSINWHLH